MLPLYECRGSIVVLLLCDYRALIVVQAIDCVVIVRLQGMGCGVAVP